MLPVFAKTTQNNGHYAVHGHSGSPILIDWLIWLTNWLLDSGYLAYEFFIKVIFNVMQDIILKIVCCAFNIQNSILSGILRYFL